MKPSKASQWSWNNYADTPGTGDQTALLTTADAEAREKMAETGAGSVFDDAPAPRRPVESGHELDRSTQWLHQRLARQIDPGVLESGDSARSRTAIYAAARSLLALEAPEITGQTKEELIAAVADEILGFGPIDPLLRDDNVSEIMVNGPDLIYYERDGRLYESVLHFRDTTHIMRVVERIVAPLGRRIDEASPMVDARLPDGSRVNVIIPPLSPDSPTMTIRKFRTDRFGIDDLVRVEAMTSDMRDFLGACVRAKINIAVSGGTGSGKTTLLNALSSFLPDRERIVTIEDPLELRLQQRHVVRLEARPAGLEGRGEISQRDLFRNALRMRPDRILVGEVRGPEAFDMLQAMNTGHEGSMTTLHANAPRDALGRLESLVLLAGLDIPLDVIREQIASALHLIVQVARLADGRRRVTHITEVAGMTANTIMTQDIFRFAIEGRNAQGGLLGRFEATGVRPHFMDKLALTGYTVTPETFRPRRAG